MRGGGEEVAEVGDREWGRMNVDDAKEMQWTRTTMRTMMRTTNADRDAREADSDANSDADRDANKVNNDAYIDVTKSSISVLYTNAQSLVNKINKMRVVVAINNPDILIVTET